MFVRKMGVLLAAIAIAAGFGVSQVRAGDDGEIRHRATVKVEPVYPELARKLNLSGTVKVKIAVAPNGTVTDAKAVGGHPVLVNAAVDAARKWRFEPTPTGTTGILEFTFERRP